MNSILTLLSSYQSEYVFFAGFLVLIFSLLAVDLFVVSRHSHKVSLKEALSWTVVWVSVAIGFYFVLLNFGHLIHGVQTLEDIAAMKLKYKHMLHTGGMEFVEALAAYNHNLATEFITGYVLEYTLSIDNIFVIILVFNSFQVNEKYYKEILFWGVLGAVIMRFLFIFLGAMIIERFEWILYIFGAFLVYTGLKMVFSKEEDSDIIDPATHPITKLARRFVAIFPRYVKGNFFIKKDGTVHATPLFVVLLVVEFTDLIFAVDSVPAVFSVTKDPYIVFYSNIFAILGLRTMFFFLTHMVQAFRFLKPAISALLVFIGGKMILAHWLHEIGYKSSFSLYFIVTILTLAVLASILIPEKKQEAL